MKISRKILLLFVSIFCFNSFIKSQDIQFNWSHIIGNGSNNYGKSIVTDSCDFIYVSGAIQNTINFIDTTIICDNIGAGFLAKLDSSGHVIWLKWGHWGQEITSLAIDHENNLYAVGTYMSRLNLGDTILITNNVDTTFLTMYIAKYNPNGNLLWAKTIMGTRYIAGTGSMPLKKITIDNNNDVIITGRCIDNLQYFDTTAIVTVQSPITGFLAKYSSTGQKLWVKKIGGANCYPYAVKTDNSKNIIVTGNFIDSAIFDAILIQANWSGASNIFLAKYNTFSNIKWVQRAGGTNDNFGQDIAIDSLNNIYITGQVNGNNIEFDSTIYFSAMEKGYTAKYDSIGNIVWLLPISGTYGYSLAINHNNIYMLGHFINSITILNTTLTSQDGHDMFLLKLDLNRNLLKAGQYVENGWIYPNDMTIDKNNNIYFVATLQPPSIWSYDIIVGKFGIDIPVNIIANYNQEIELLLYPNPCNDKVYINLNNIDKKILSIEIFDITSKLVYSAKINNNYIDVSNLQTGIYLLKIANDKTIISKKIVINN